MAFIFQTIRNWQRFILDWVVRYHPNLDLAGRAESFVKIFEKYIQPGNAILDIGGGWGFYAEPMKQRGAHLQVLDVVKPGLQKCPVIVYEGGRIPFTDKSYDVSMFVTVLHHIEDIDSVITEAKRVTKQYVVVIEDVYHHGLGRLWTILRDMIYNFEYIGHPCNFRKQEEWITKFREHGFELVMDKKVYTWLSGMRILNGVMVFEVGS